MLDGVIEKSTKKVVGCGDGVEVASEVKIDVFHWDDLSVSTAGSAAFDAKDWAKGWFSKGRHGVLADLSKTVGKTDAGCGLAFACWSWGDRGDEDQFAFLAAFL